MHAVILERNKLVGRKVARLFMAAGGTATTVEEPAQVADLLATADVLCADAFDGELVAEQLRAKADLQGVLWTAEPLRRTMKFLVEDSRIDHVLGRKDFESAPRDWEVLLVARRFNLACAAPPFVAYLDWGFAGFELEIRGSDDRNVALRRVQDLVATLAVPKRVSEMFGELCDELIMNAMYDAPVDTEGRPKYAFDRKANVALLPSERPTLRCGTDGTRVVLQLRDPFGRLKRKHVFDGLARGLEGEMDSSHGGAGLGMLVCHNTSSALFFDVLRDRHTEVTAMFELDQNLREFRTQPRSIHFWSRV